MKKILLGLVIGSLGLLTIGCENKANQKAENIIQISALKLEDDYITGKIKNTDSEKAYDITITFDLKSGTLEDTGYCYESLKPSETKDLECLMYDIDGTYTFEIQNIELEEITIPSLSEGEIDNDTLEYHFEEIYDNHINNLLLLVNSLDSEYEYPYIDSINYKGDLISIQSNFISSNNSISITEMYNSENEELFSILVIAQYQEEDFVKELTNYITFMNFLPQDTNSRILIKQVLSQKDLELGNCYNIGEWCIAPTYDSNIVSFTFTKG